MATTFGGKVGSVTVDVSGITRIAGQLDKRAADVIAKAALDVESDAKENAPVDTGALKASIFTEILSGGATARVGPTVSYGIFQELGTHKMRAHPYLIPALERVRASFLAAWKELVG